MRPIWPLLAALMAAAPPAGADEPATKLEVVTPKAIGIVATGINGRGDVIGFEWMEEKERPGVIAQVPFLARGKMMTYLPLLAGYTANFPAAVSDDGLVVGRVSKPAPPGVRVMLRNQAYAWDETGGIRGLGTLPDDFASIACGVTRDGRCISGYSVGPDRIRACLWERAGDGWKATPLTHASRLGSTVVAISGNGRYVAAVDGVLPCLWSRGASGEWTREAIGESGSIIPRAVNDSGTLVGLRNSAEGYSHAVVWSRDEGIKVIDEPKGYVRSEASAVNNAGIVVGMADGPAGSEIGPSAFAYEGGRLRIITERGPAFTAATAINDRGQVAGVFEEPEEPAPAAKGAPDPAGRGAPRP